MNLMVPCLVLRAQWGVGVHSEHWHLGEVFDDWRAYHSILTTASPLVAVGPTLAGMTVKDGHLEILEEFLFQGS